MKMTDTDTPTVLFGIRRDRSDTGIATMTSTPNVNVLRRRLGRDYETLQEQIRNTTKGLGNSSPRYFSVSNSNSSGQDFKKLLVQPAEYDGSDPWEDYTLWWKCDGILDKSPCFGFIPQKSGPGIPSRFRVGKATVV